MMGQTQGKIIGWLVQIFMMAVTWAIIDTGIMGGFADDFFGKLILCAFIWFVAKIVALFLGG